jgi:hypothetical protein
MDFRDALAGAVGACCLVAVGAPFDTIKVISQTGGASGPLTAMRAVVRAHGVRALWRGAGPALASALTENVVLFSAHGVLLRALLASRGADAPPLSSSAHALLGATSAIFSATAICPAEVVKCRAQAVAASAERSLGVAAAAAALLRAEGPRVFFSGLAPLLARDLPLISIMFTVERAVSDALLRAGAGADERAVLGGGIGGAVAWAAVFPFDVVKSRAQVQARVGAAREGLAAALATAAREGALFRGVSAAVVRAFVANGALFWGVRTAETALR